MNRITFSPTELFVHGLHDGQLIYASFVRPFRLRESVHAIKEYIRETFGDDSPTIDPELTRRMEAADRAWIDLAAKGERYR